MQAHHTQGGGTQHNPAREFHLKSIQDVPEKICQKCGESWPADTEFFYRQAGRPDGLGSLCKACYAETPSMIKRNAGKKKRLDTGSPWEVLFQEGARHGR